VSQQQGAADFLGAGARIGVTGALGNSFFGFLAGGGDTVGSCPVPLTVRGTQALVSFAPLAFKLLRAARQNAVLRRSSFPPL